MMGRLLKLDVSKKKKLTVFGKQRVCMYCRSSTFCAKPRTDCLCLYVYSLNRRNSHETGCSLHLCRSAVEISNVTSRSDTVQPEVLNTTVNFEQISKDIFGAVDEGHNYSTQVHQITLTGCVVYPSKLLSEPICF